MPISPSNPSPAETRAPSAASFLVKAAVLVIVLSAAGLLEIHQLHALADPHCWLELSVGSWILQHHALPHTGIFSQLSAMHWADPDWGYQIALGVLYKLAGLRAIPIARISLQMLFALAAFLLGGGRRGHFWRGVALSLWAQIALSPMLAQEMLLSGVLFAVELGFLLESRRSGRTLHLYLAAAWLLVWANVDWHFVFGLAVLLFFVAVNLIERKLQSARPEWGLRPVPALSPIEAGWIAGGGIVATLVSPYGVLSYPVSWERWFGAGWQNWRGTLGTEFPATIKSMDFRSPAHFLLMLLLMIALVVVGRQRLRDPFKAVLLLLSGALAFTYQVEVWAAAIAAVAVLGDWQEATAASVDSPPGRARVLAPAVAAALILTVAAGMKLPANPALLKVVGRTFPTKACEFAKDHHLRGPLYNEIAWGDFLTWALPGDPVSADSRSELYGQSYMRMAYNVASGKTSPWRDPAFQAANTVVLSTENPNIKGPELFPDPQAILKKAFPGFKELYRDQQAVVLSREP